MKALLIIALFTTTALSLYFTAGKKAKIAGGFDVVSLCLIVAVAYQFDLISTIIWVMLSVTVVLLIAFVIMRKYRKDKKVKVIEDGGK
jgi:hypothetical protein